jgi:hypothetical protein
MVASLHFAKHWRGVGDRFVSVVPPLRFHPGLRASESDDRADGSYVPGWVGFGYALSGAGRRSTDLAIGRALGGLGAPGRRSRRGSSPPGPTWSSHTAPAHVDRTLGVVNLNAGVRDPVAQLHAGQPGSG